MRTLTIEVADPDRARRRFEAALEGHRQGDVLSFPGAESLLETFTPWRWRLLAVLQAEGPLQIRCLAQALGWDEQRVLSALAPLLRLGVVQRVGEAVHVPYGKIRLHLVLQKEPHRCAS